MSVLLETSLGAIVIDLYCLERPKCSLNFIKLCQMKQFNFCLFHSVQQNLVVQTGDPTGTGRGGFSIFHHLYGDQARYFDTEKKPKITHDRRGLVSMVDNGYGQHGSQFFITLADNLEYLDEKHSVFGYIAEGLEFVDKINDVFCDKENRPFRNLRIHHTLVLEDPFDNPPDLSFPESPTRFSLSFFAETGPPRIEEDEELGEPNDLSPKRLEQLKAEQEASTNAQLLTLIGDLPDPDIKPPDNVLFVCRLNPVTTAEDLEIIFSRFGDIQCCEVVRDKKTNMSLQYAFVEFENEADCENAFFKMDKVVIDDRRIHVDFSQSVAKQWQQHKSDKAASGPPPRSSSTYRDRHTGDHQPSRRQYRHDDRRSPPQRQQDRRTRDTATKHGRSPPQRQQDRRTRDTAAKHGRSPPQRQQDRRTRDTATKLRRSPSSSSDDALPLADGLDIVVSDSDGSTSSSSQSPVQKKRKEKHRNHHESKKAKKSKTHKKHHKKKEHKHTRHK